MHMVKAGVMENIYAHNNHIAEHVRHYLTERNIFAVNVMGAPGTGKTTSLEHTSSITFSFRQTEKCFSM